VAFSVMLEVGVAAGISAGVGNWWLMRRSVASGPKPKPKAKKAAKPKPKVFGDGEARRPLPGHWLDATECDTQPIPVVRDDWTDEHDSAGTFADVAPVAPAEKPPRRIPRALRRRPVEKAPEAAPAPRRDIVDENDDRGGHVIYMDPYAWDRDAERD
jgi:hypothetical protein